MTRIRVDFNRLVRGDVVKASARRADGPLSVGDAVVAYEAGDPLVQFPATVREIDYATNAVLLDVEWANELPRRRLTDGR